MIFQGDGQRNAVISSNSYKTKMICRKRHPENAAIVNNSNQINDFCEEIELRGRLLRKIVDFT